MTTQTAPAPAPRAIELPSRGTVLPVTTDRLVVTPDALAHFIVRRVPLVAEPGAALWSRVAVGDVLTVWRRRGAWAVWWQRALPTRASVETTLGAHALADAIGAGELEPLELGAR